MQGEMRTNLRLARRSRLRLLAGGSLLVLAAVAFCAEPAPPVTYHGRSVNEWLLRAASKADADRQAAEAAFRAMGAQAVPGLIAAARAPQTSNETYQMEYDRKRAAADMLGQIGPGGASAIPQLVAAIEDPNPSWVDQAAVLALGSIGPPALPQLLAALHSPKTWVQARAAEVLGTEAFRPRLDEVLPALIAVVNGPNCYCVRHDAVRSLGTLKDPRAAPTLAAALQDDDPAVRELAAEALLKLGPAAASVAGAIRDSLIQPRARAPFSPDRSSIRLAAVLWHATGDTNTAQPFLEQALQGSDRVFAAKTLGEVGPSASVFIPALSRCLKAEIVDVAPGKPGPVEHADVAAIGRAMVRIGSPSVSPLVLMLGEARPEVRRRAAIALGSLGTNAAPAVRALLKATEDTNSEVQIAAIEALGAIGPAASAALPRLRHIVEQSASGTDTADLLQITAEIAVDAINSEAQPTVATAPPVTVR
jgi:HEAT repeat protein